MLLLLLILDELPKYEVAGQALDTYYLTQGTLHYNSESVITDLGLIYYTYPDLSALTNSTWITNLWEEAIGDLAKSWLYSAIGDKENGNKLFNDWRVSAKDIKNTE